MEGAMPDITPDRAVRGGAPSLTWRRDDLRPADWLVPVPDACDVEFDAIAEALRRHGGPVAELDPAALSLDAIRETMDEVRARLDRGPGFAVLDRVPVERYGTEENRAIGWILANLVGRIVAQKWDGTRLYDVRDSGKALAHGVRRSITNLEQQFHTDGGWLTHTPACVGLYCIQPAAEGGMSRLASLLTVHQELTSRPQLLERLYQPFCWDRQAEHGPGDVAYSRAPVYWRDGDAVLARYYGDYVDKGQELAGEPLDSVGVEALQAMRAIADDESNWVEFGLAAGQFLFVNNRQIAHSRTAFRDDQAKRHLMRFWNRDEGAPDLEG
jgi:hypothetical protein